MLLSNHKIFLTRMREGDAKAVIVGGGMKCLKRLDSFYISHSRVNQGAELLFTNTERESQYSNIQYTSKIKVWTQNLKSQQLDKTPPLTILKSYQNKAWHDTLLCLKICARNWIFATNSDFLIPVALQLNVVDIWILFK